MTDLEKTKQKLMENPDFKEEYERIRPEYEVMKAMIRARTEQGITQEELAKRTGIRQSNISRIERGLSSPNVSTLHQIAQGLGKKLYIDFK